MDLDLAEVREAVLERGFAVGVDDSNIDGAGDGGGWGGGKEVGGASAPGDLGLVGAEEYPRRRSDECALEINVDAAFKRPPRWR